MFQIIFNISLITAELLDWTFHSTRVNCNPASWKLFLRYSVIYKAQTEYGTMTNGNYFCVFPIK